MPLRRRALFAQLLLTGFVNLALASRDEASAENVTYEYDALGRLKKVSYGDGSTITYTYDPAGNRTAVQSVVPPPPPPGAPTGSLSAHPPNITSGSTSVLEWQSSNATSIVIDNGVGSVTPITSGSTSVSPATTTTYTATITGPGGQVTRQAEVAVITSQTIAVSGSAPVNLRTLANSAGYNGANANIIFEVNGGTIVPGAAGNPNGGIAIDTGTWPTGSHSITLALVIKNGAVVRGGGGAGGAGGSGCCSEGGTPGGAGGDAVSCHAPITITVNSGGVLQGGGGGGAGGGGWEAPPNYTTLGGGGGGGGAPNGTGGPAGSAEVSGSSGGSGTAASGGAGGAGATYESSSASPGGSGGAYGATGSGAWAPGFSVRKNGNTVTVTNNGTIAGTVG